jgi:Lysophospholipase L1 and related esterases
MKRILTLAFCALIALGSAFAADTNHNFAVWEKEVREFESSDRTNPPPKGAILFLGSSGIRLWKTLAADFPEHKVIGRGIGGCEIVDLTHFAERVVFPYEPKMIVFRCGGNDLTRRKSAEDVAADFKEFVAKVHSRLPDTEIVFLSWNPTIRRWDNRQKEAEFNRLVEQFAAKAPRVKYVETTDLFLNAEGKPKAELLAEDKLHFSAEGYRVLTKRVLPILPASK